MSQPFVSSRNLNSDQDLTNVLSFFKEKMFQEINTIILGQVLNVNNSTKRLIVKSLINNVDSSGKPLSPPSIFDVPYGAIRGGNAGIITEYKVNDNVIIGFCQRQIDNTKSNEQQSTPSLYRYFSLQDAIVLSHWSNDQPTIYFKITDDEITIQATTKPITINTTGNTTINSNNATINATTLAKIEAPTIELDGNITVTGSLTAGTTVLSSSTPAIIDSHPFLLHTHTLVQSGTDDSGPVL